MPKWSGGGRLSGEQHPGKEQKGKNDAEEVERVLCIFAISPWWWFRFTMDSRVVVVVSCYRTFFNTTCLLLCVCSCAQNTKHQTKVILGLRRLARFAWLTSGSGR